MRYLRNCYRIEVTGIVQGVGFRPFVYRLAQELGLTGYVLNHERGVSIEIECNEGMLRGFVEELRARAPVAARIDSIRHEEVPVRGFERFEIRKSTDSGGGSRQAGISPDLALCADCRREIHDPANRRYAYPFTNCTNCGPRYTIIREIPYDRATTTMERFRMCPSCQAEYGDPEDRRFHAQPNACAECGPSLQLLDSKGAEIRIPVHFHRNKPILDRCVALLRQGKILAMKGIGGFHLACDAANEAAVQTLRERKGRDRKPFAVMFPSVEHARRVVELSEEEITILSSVASPILLARRCAAGAGATVIAEGVAPGQPRLGVFLPYSPFHELLLTAFAKPLVMTSGNFSDDPIEIENEDASARFAGLADAILVHDRPIEVRCDDSVVQESHGRPFFFRRSRGYSPLGVRLSEPLAQDLVAVGAGLKNTICVGKKGRPEAILSQHIGDLDSPRSLEFFEATAAHLEKLLGLRPKAIAHDLHPEFPSTRWAEERAVRAGVRAIPVQHHHAHIAACLEREGKAVKGPVIGLALDGTGLGTDGTIWGGEIFLADRRDFLRVGKLHPVRLPGGDYAIKHPWRVALAYLKASGVPSGRIHEILADVPREHVSLVTQALDKNLNCFTSTSCGRLFDAFSAISGLCREARYEGEAAIGLEAALGRASPDLSGEAYEFPVLEEGKSLEIDWRPAVRKLVSELPGIVAGEASRRFHVGLVRGLIEASEKVAKRYSIRSIALSGGCFLNTFLRETLRTELESRGFQVLLPLEVPCNDGGVSFGQAVVANQVLKGARSCVWQFR